MAVVGKVTIMTIKFSNFGDKSSVNFSFVGLCAVVDKGLGKRRLTSLPSPLGSGSRARVLSGEPRKRAVPAGPSLLVKFLQPTYQERKRQPPNHILLSRIWTAFR